MTGLTPAARSTLASQSSVISSAQARACGMSERDVRAAVDARRAVRRGRGTPSRTAIDETLLDQWCEITDEEFVAP